MNEPVRLFVLFLDEISERAWRAPLAQAAEVGGWDVLTGPVSDWAQMTHRCLVLSVDPDWGLVIPADHSVVIVAGPPSAPPGHLSELETKEAVAALSARLSKASMIVAQGGVLAAATAPQLAVPILGEVSRPEGPVAVPITRPCAVSMYRSLPPRPGASALWPSEGFWYNVGDKLDGGPSEFDLTGRARIAVNGPHIYLTPGVWRAVLEVSVDPEGGMAQLEFQWAHGDAKVTYDASIREPGRYRIELERRWSVAGPAQIVVIVKRALFEGRFEMHDCKVEMIES